MAVQEEIGLTYNWLDRFFPHIFGPTADITCAYYNGDYSKPLEQAQRDKQSWILERLDFSPGFRLLDIGSGWGNMLEAVRERGGEALGLTLSSAQAERCRRRGLKVLLRDWRDLKPGETGPFDGIVCIGAFEHFCSPEEYREGRQMAVYRRFFDLCRELLGDSGRLYLQTMTWGPRVPDPANGGGPALDAAERRIYQRLRVFYPGSWLPGGRQQIEEAARGSFTLLDWNEGRSDYIRTLEEWQRGIRRYLARPTHWPAVLATLLRHALTDPGFLERPVSLLAGDQCEVFRRRLFEHYRMFFGKR